jgi:quercetin dioxygenase-like cupin family protein
MDKAARDTTGPLNPGAAFLSPAGASELRWMGQTSTHFLATGAQTDGQFCLVEECAHKGESVPMHRHRDDRESFYVLEGEISFYLGDAPGQRAGAGAFAHIPGGIPHGFRIESQTARYLILTTQRHGEFYRAITHPSRSGGLPSLEAIDGARIKAACAEFGIEFIGPLPEA